MNFYKKLNIFIFIFFLAGCYGINSLPAKLSNEIKNETPVMASEKIIPSQNPVASQIQEPATAITPIPSSQNQVKKVKSVEISQKNITLEINKNIALSASVLIESGEQNSAVEWSSSDNSIVTVNSSGIVNAFKKGTVVIKAVSIQNKQIFDSCIVTVTDSELDKPSVVEITNISGQSTFYEKSTLKLSGIVKYVNGTFDSNILWKSSNDSIATVDTDGLVTGLKMGSVIISAVSNKNSSVVSYYKLTILEKTVSSPVISSTPTPVITSTVASVLISNSYATVPKSGDILQLSAIVTMLDNSHPNTEVTWSSSDTSIATVDSAGKVNTLKPGSVSITATSKKDNTKKNSAILNVVSFSLTGKIVFRTTRDGNAEIYVMNANGSNQTNLTNNSSNEFEPSVSPNGDKIVFTSDRNGNDEIYLMNIDGSNLTRLTNNPSGDNEASFSRDGSKIVFISNRDGNQEIYVMNANGFNQTRITNTPENEFSPMFSPDGSKIAFGVGGTSIWLMNANGTNRTQITTAPNYNTQPAWSPDGSKIAFYTRRDGNYEIYIMNSDGTNQKNLSNISSTEWSSWFSPDGSMITFSSDRYNAGKHQIYIMNSDGTNQTRITYSAEYDTSPTWSK